jgi:hypothetical protein
MKNKWTPVAALVLNTPAGEDNMSVAARVLKNERANQSRLRQAGEWNHNSRKIRAKREQPVQI